MYMYRIIFHTELYFIGLQNRNATSPGDSFSQTCRYALVDRSLIDGIYTAHWRFIVSYQYKDTTQKMRNRALGVTEPIPTKLIIYTT